MIGFRDLPRSAQAWVVRWTAMIMGGATIASVIISEIIMLIISQGMNAQGLIVSVAMPLVLGTPMLTFMLIQLQKLRIANDKLVELAATDWLTGCFNRRGFTQLVTSALESGEAGVLLVIDADRFKVVNDRFGHDQGDEALVRIAGAIRHSLRPDDSLGRLGGEEFSAYLAGADQATAEVVAERIRHAVEKLDFAPQGASHPLSVSIGAALANGPAAFAPLFRQADQCLYQAKRDGRNCVRFVADAATAEAAAA